MEEDRLEEEPDEVALELVAETNTIEQATSAEEKANFCEKRANISCFLSSRKCIRSSCSNYRAAAISKHSAIDFCHNYSLPLLPCGSWSQRMVRGCTTTKVINVTI